MNQEYSTCDVSFNSFPDEDAMTDGSIMNQFLDKIWIDNASSSITFEDINEEISVVRTVRYE